MNSLLLGITILMPMGCGILCYLLRNHILRTLLISINALLLIVASIFLLKQGGFTFTPAPFWNTIITICDFILLLYFLYIGIAKKHLVIVLLALLQIVPLAYFEIVQAHKITVPQPLVIDQLAIIMCLIVSIIGSLICLYAIQYMKDHEHHLGLSRSRQHIFFLFFVLFLGAMNGLVFSNNLLWLYFFWEVTTLCCYQLINHDQTDESNKSAIRALWMNLIGGVAFVFALILIFNTSDTLAISEVIHNPSAALLLLPLALLCLAGFTKSAQVPFQNWLLGAMVAPTPVSALLHSSTMVNAGVYLVLRFSPAFHGTVLSTMVMLVGAFTFLATAIFALTQSNAKKLLAYSTIGNLGIIVMCAGINTPLAISAALILLVFHAISKGLLFLCAGVIENAIHSRDIEKMAELVVKFPLTTAITVIGIITMFLAPFGLLIGKWATLEGAISADSQWAYIAAIMLVLGSAATTVFWTKYLGRLINRPAESWREKRVIEAMAFLYKLPLISLVLIIIVLSILIAPFYNAIIIPALKTGYGIALNTTSNWDLLTPVGSFATWPLFIVVAIVLLMPLLMLRAKKEEISPVYMCGENSPIDSCEFCTVADKYEPLQISGLYFTDMVTETALEKLFTPIGVIILIVLFGLLL